MQSNPMTNTIKIVNPFSVMNFTKKVRWN